MLEAGKYVTLSQHFRRKKEDSLRSKNINFAFLNAVATRPLFRTPENINSFRWPARIPTPVPGPRQESNVHPTESTYKTIPQHDVPHVPAPYVVTSSKGPLAGSRSIHTLSSRSRLARAHNSPARHNTTSRYRIFKI
ncbi:hypothetical protein D9611_014764 [Ephemerocybe angulata]|uniref:Uncharacterized protein n=1 Tax=Ephemerocybe angulata TaxID=980116 RepID=A0A8H5F9E5_9AGAR|nr:hypothetical protein D9611_014764 [Tulosesus angulatus]